MSEARRRMLEGLPLTERRVVLAGAATTVLEGGAGPPLLLLHGGIECGGAYWAPVVERLAARNRLVIPDLPGLGESEPLAKLDHASFGRWLAEVVDATCERAPLLVAHSLLGSFAARECARDGGGVRSLVIYGSPGVAPFRMPLGLKLAAIRVTLRPTPRNNERFERYALLDLDDTRARMPDWFAAFEAYSLECARLRHVKRTMGTLIKLGSKPVPPAELEAARLPVSLLWGRGDRMTPLALAEQAQARFGWPLRVIERAGHVPHIERPDEFAAALEEVARGRPPVPARA